MTFKKTFSSLLVFLQTFFYLAPQAFADDPTDPVFIYNQAYAPVPVNQPGQPAGETTDPTSTGAFTYSIPLSLPPGRNGLQPNLALQYSSQQTSASTWLGYGWGLSIPSIQRFNKKGMDTMYEENNFSSSLDGELEENTLSDTTHGTYKAKVEHGAFNTYEFESDGSWTVTDKSGTVYTFGSSSDSRIENPDDSTQVYQWYIEEIRDTNDNFISFAYTKDENKVYPSTITYTGHGSTAGNFTISFTLTAERSDQITNFESGFKVTTNYLIDTITASIDGTWVRKYDLDYTEPEDRYRYLLSSVTLSAQTEDGTSTTTLPSTTFTYETSSPKWIVDDSYSIPLYFLYKGTSGIRRDTSVRMMDINGDALPDLVSSQDNDGTIKSDIYINTGSGWEVDSDYIVPVGFRKYSSTYGGYDLGVRIMDVNGDGLPDFVKSYSGFDGDDYASNGVYINQGSEKNWELDSDFSIPLSFAKNPSGTSHDTCVHTCDVNGDGLPDLLTSSATILSSDGSYRYDDDDGTVYLNNGSTWEIDSEYIIPIPLKNNYTDMGVTCDDVNGDGLPDLVQGFAGENHVYINQGPSKTWKLDSSYEVPISLVYYNEHGPYDGGARLLDVNGDNSSDIIEASQSTDGYSGNGFIYLHQNNNSAWNSKLTTDDYDIPVGFVKRWSSSGQTVDVGTRFGDVNGDGLVDIVTAFNDKTDSDEDEYNGVYLNTGKVVDLLTGINLSTGASISVTYQSSAQQTNPNLPYVVQTPVTIEKDDGLGNTVTINYTFENGSQFFDADNIYSRKFAGFGKITKTEEGRITTSYYHQGNEDDSSTGEFEDSEKKIGLLYRSDVSDSSDGSDMSKSLTRYNVTGNFVYPTQTVQMLYTGSSHVDTATSSTYDTENGNLLTQTTWGEVTASDDGSFTDSTGDSLTTTYAYASSSSSVVKNAPSSVTLTDETGATVSNTKFYYDNLANGKISKGNKTKTENQINSSTVATTTAVYNSYGLVTSTTDDNTHTTSFSYDSKKLYPTTVTNALGYKTTFTYDYSSGQKKVVTDPNGIKMTQKYDAFDRLTSVSHADPESASKTVTIEKHVYDDTSSPRSEKVVRYFNSTTTNISYQYIDGWNRPIQTRQMNEDNSTYYVQDTTYNNFGLVKTKSLPYKSKGTSKTTATTDSTLLSEYTYDALARKTSVTQVMGTITLDYDGRTVTMTDTLGNEKEFVYDSYNRLTQVKEKNDADTYTTSYTYNALSKMTQLTDAAGNIQSFTYDMLGRLLTKTLLHQSTATTIDTWTYTYDGVGNLLQTTSPRSLTTTKTYDALNRVITDDRSKDITFTYDTCTYGIGRVCTAKVSGSITSTYVYGPTGLVQTESRTIDGTKYTTSYSYDWAGNLTTLTYPDFSKTTTTYNRTGLPETITYTGVDGTSTLILESASYSPLHQIEKLEFGNGTTTNYDFDSSDFYRLKERSVTFDTENIQTASYTYDAMLNITGLSETSDSYEDIASFFTYDDLYRLTKLDLTIGSVSTTRSYTYNSIGNITSDSDVGTYTYNTRHPQAVKTVGSYSLTYNGSGSLMSDGTWTHTWNEMEQITKSVSTETELKYYYDHTGTRIMKENTTDGDYLVTVNEAFDATPTEYRKHILLPVYGSMATVTTNTLTNESEIIYHHNDHLGSHGVNTDEEGAIAEKIQYDPFGTVREKDSISYEDNYTFTGKQNDEETGLQYFGARYYFPAIARFISQDPWAGSPTNPQSLNKYTYGLNNPLRYNDPTGAVYGDFQVEDPFQQINYTSLRVGAWQLIKGLVIGPASFTATGAATAAMITKPVGITGAIKNSSLTQMAVGSMLSDLNQASIDTTNAVKNIMNAFENKPPEIFTETGMYDNMGLNEFMNIGSTITTGHGLVTKNPTNVIEALTMGNDLVSISTGENFIIDIIDQIIIPDDISRPSQYQPNSCQETTISSYTPPSTTVQVPHGTRHTGVSPHHLSQGLGGTHHQYQGNPPSVAKHKR